MIYLKNEKSKKNGKIPRKNKLVINTRSERYKKNKLLLEMDNYIINYFNEKKVYKKYILSWDKNDVKFVQIFKKILALLKWNLLREC